MEINGRNHRTIWLAEEGRVQIIDQRFLPHELIIEDLFTTEDAARAIREMHVRGAPLIGVTAAYGMYLAIYHGPGSQTLDNYLESTLQQLQQTRPTAVDLFNALTRVKQALNGGKSLAEKVVIARDMALKLAEESIDFCRQIGLNGLPLIEAIHQQKPGEPVNILTHCNAGWLACIDHGTATSPIYTAHDRGIPVHVWVDETRPRNQGARLTAFELDQQGIPHTVIADNTGGHLMQHGKVDLVLVGSDRTTRTGDVANKIGTYLKALAAFDNQIPFYVALPSTSFDFGLRDGLAEIPIEERSGEEVRFIQGKGETGLQQVLLTPEGSPALNYGFDITPARLVTGLITERGICAAREADIMKMFQE
ncbi:MAG: methylthioribose-1-phosphate isomerase [Saprospiraceae bacterium]|nr:MAG: methylthioribose-1-phosphate isomerase [Saprospiraceae bacterium]